MHDELNLPWRKLGCAKLSLLLESIDWPSFYGTVGIDMQYNYVLHKLIFELLTVGIRISNNKTFHITCSVCPISSMKSVLSLQVMTSSGH